MRNEDYDQQKILYERFIENSNLKDFDKMKKLSDNNYFYSNLNKKQFNIKNLFHGYLYNHPLYEIFNKLKINKKDNFSSANVNDLKDSFTPNEINDYKLDFNNIIYDPDYKNKCLKGNCQWGKMKFNMQKLNMAKRRGISFEDFKIHKIDKNLNKLNKMEINGRFIIGNIYNNSYKNINKTEINKEYNKNIIMDIINKNSDFIKRKYSGKNNAKSFNNRYILNENKIYDLIIFYDELKGKKKSNQHFKFKI